MEHPASITQLQIDEVQAKALKLLEKVTRFNLVSEQLAYAMVGAGLCLIVDTLTGKVSDLPRLSSFWTVLGLLVLFFCSARYTDYLLRKLKPMHAILGYVAHDVTVEASTD